MIVAGILMIVIGVAIALWTFLQTTTGIANVDADKVEKFKSYFLTKVDIKQKVLEAQQNYDEVLTTNDADKIEVAKKNLDRVSEISRSLGDRIMKLEGLEDAFRNGLYIFAIALIILGALCVFGYFAFDRKRKGVIHETAMARFNEKKGMFTVGCISLIVGFIVCGFAWVNYYTTASTLVRETNAWNEKIEGFYKIDVADRDADKYLIIDAKDVLSDFNESLTLPLAVTNTLQIVGLLLIAFGAVTTASIIGNACKTKLFPVFNGFLLIVFGVVILFPIYKTLVDSLDAMAGSGINFVPKKFTLLAYKEIVTESMLYRPFIISVITTIAGTLLGLTLSTLGAYVLIQFEMPGRNFFANMLLFTMIFSGGMIPSYLLLSDLKLTNTLWAVILPLGIDVYNLVLMRNFFEGIPGSLFEAAQIDGCSPMQIFIKIVLPLSKAAIASIGLMFSVKFWNDYTNFKLYITNNKLYNFQMRLRTLMDGSETNSDVTLAYTDTTMSSAVVIVAIIPFMIIYPFCQNYFVQGVNVGAVKE